MKHGGKLHQLPADKYLLRKWQQLKNINSKIHIPYTISDIIKQVTESKSRLFSLTVAWKQNIYPHTMTNQSLEI